MCDWIKQVIRNPLFWILAVIFWMLKAVYVMDNECANENCAELRALNESYCSDCIAWKEQETQIRNARIEKSEVKRANSKILDTCKDYSCDNNLGSDPYSEYCFEHRCYYVGCKNKQHKDFYCKDHAVWAVEASQKKSSNTSGTKKKNTVHGYSNPEDLYYDNMEEFHDIDEAEEYFYDMLY